MSHPIFSSDQNCWNPLWLLVLVLHFDDETFQNFASFRHFVSLVFLLRDITLPLQSFHLKCSNTSGIQPQDINGFVHAAAQRGIESLNLEMSCMVTLPRSILHCKTLVVHHLKGLRVNDISHVVVEFPLLKTLHMSNVTIERFKYLFELLSGCPIIEELQADDLSVQNVEWFFRKEKSVLAKKFLSLLPNMIRASITKSPSYLTNVVPILCAEAQVLRAEFNMSIGNIDLFHNLTYMELIIKHNHGDKWKWLLGMLKHCPKLQHFTVHEDVENGEEVVDSLVDPANIPECLSTQLKTCLLKGYNCTDCELQFAKYIIQKY